MAKRKERPSDDQQVLNAPEQADDKPRKRCVACGESKTYAWFTRDRRSPDGLGDTCAPCRRDRANVKRRAHAELVSRQDKTEEGFVRVSFAEFFGGDVDAMQAHFHDRGFVQDEGGRWVPVAFAEIPF
jgi:hypothetical protein